MAARPLPAPVPSPRASAGGFTLLEILVVLVIIAVLTTLGTIAVGTLGADRGVEDEVDRYADVVATATEQAQLEGRDYGVHFAPGGYRVLVYAAARDRWEAIADDRLYEFRAWPDGVRVVLEIEGRPVPLVAPATGALPTPQVLLFASGDVSPYRLRLAREGTDAAYAVDGRPDGTLGVTKPGDPAPAAAGRTPPGTAVPPRPDASAAR